MKKKYFFLILITLVSCNAKNKIHRESIDLNGSWQFRLDTANVGIQQHWYLSDIYDNIQLPGTTDMAKKGFLNTDSTTMHLSRVYTYEGAAWYRKKVIIPEKFRDKHIQLHLERTKTTKIWIDNQYIGGSELLQTAQQFDVSNYLTPGEHFISICVDNRLQNTPYGNVHIYSDDTQTNWNGIIGKINLEASDKTYISNLQVYPDIENKKIHIKMEIDNRLNLKNANIGLYISKQIGSKTQQLSPLILHKTLEANMELEYELGTNCSLWDEYSQPIYTLTAIVSEGAIKDSKTVEFGMRKFTTKGTQFEINGRTTFLRGKHEAAVFPLTGCVPTNMKDWTHVFKIAKSYGINHYRFHSYCPPEVAFQAADREGIYIQVELPFWGGLESDTVAEKLKKEGLAMLKAYGNHPSFVMFSLGNEIWSGHDKVEKNIIAFKQYDNRPLYTMGSNNGIGYVPPRSCSDFFVGARTPSAGDTTLTHTRLTHAFADSKEGGLLNTKIPSTDFEFNYPVSQLNIPIISHEIGQYQIYPDYNEIDKYTGVLKARNLEIFRNRLKQSGMYDQNVAFHKASGAWSALCYKAEMEAAIRTKGFGGFQLLDLQDYPGQGTALVGILDAFMDSKKVVSEKVWRQSCNDIVLLLEFPKYCWSTTEKFHAKMLVANYSSHSFNNKMNWEIKKQNGDVIQRGIFSDITAPCGEISVLGEIGIDFSSFAKAEKLTINLSIPETDYSNSYPIWVYNASSNINIPEDIIVTETINDNLIDSLQNGSNVLLFPTNELVYDRSFAGLFPPEFWNYGMFKGISEWVKKPVSSGTLGILTNPKHPLFNCFPTDFHTNWQWFSIIKASNVLILDSTINEYKPIVQVIDNLERNHKLGLIFEFKVGKGKLLVCMSQLNRIAEKPEAAQLYQSIINYMKSADFKPTYEPGSEKLKKILGIK